MWAPGPLLAAEPAGEMGLKAPRMQFVPRLRWN